MGSRPSDLPFKGEGSPKTIPWIVGFMIYLAILSLMGAISLNTMIVQWDQGFKNGFSIELSPPEGRSPESMKPEIQRQKKILDVLAQVPGIKRTQVIAKTSISSTSDSWWGTEEENLGLPLPTIIDVEVIPGTPLDFYKIQEVLDDLVPGTRVSKEREWRKGLKEMAQVFLGISIIVAGLIGFSTLAIASFTTHTGLVIYSRIVEILHVVGAQNSYIAQQFQGHILRIGVKASFLGIGLFWVTLGVLLCMGLHFNVPSIKDYFPLHHIVLISLGLPCVIALTMMGVARLTVLWTLRNLP